MKLPPLTPSRARKPLKIVQVERPVPLGFYKANLREIYSPGEIFWFQSDSVPRFNMKQKLEGAAEYLKKHLEFEFVVYLHPEINNVVCVKKLLIDRSKNKKMRLPDFSKDKEVIALGFGRGCYGRKMKHMEIGDKVEFGLFGRPYRNVQCAILVAGKRLEKRGMKFRTCHDPDKKVVVCIRIE